MPTVQEISQEEKASALLPLLVFSFPEGRYTADAGKWANAILELKNTYDKTYPLLFKKFHFRRSARGDSYSSEVSNFLAFLQFSSATEVHNPGYTTMAFKENTREILYDTYAQALQPDELKAIKDMSSKVAAQLQIPLKQK